MFHHKYKDKSFSGVTCETSFPVKRSPQESIPLHSLLPSSPVCGGKQDFKQDMLVGGNFFRNFSGGNKKEGGIQYFVVAQWGELVEAG